METVIWLISVRHSWEYSSGQDLLWYQTMCFWTIGVWNQGGATPFCETYLEFSLSEYKWLLIFRLFLLVYRLSSITLGLFFLQQCDGITQRAKQCFYSFIVWKAKGLLGEGCAFSKPEIPVCFSVIVLVFYSFWYLLRILG